MKDLGVLYRDEVLLAVNKPSGLAVHRGAARDRIVALGIVRDAVGHHVHAVHRLDRATSGALLFALDPETARRMSAQFEAGEVEKRYLALVRGIPPEEGVIDHPIPRVEDGPRVPAVTEFRRLATYERYALVEARPLTGRLHQIRRHFKHLSHPLIGDVRYGKGEHNRLFRERFGLHRLALHALELAFDHPETGERVRIIAPVPEDLAGPLRAMGMEVAAKPTSHPPGEEGDCSDAGGSIIRRRAENICLDLKGNISWLQTLLKLKTGDVVGCHERGVVGEPARAPYPCTAVPDLRNRGMIMEARIAALTPEQAERALLLFYDLLPRENWESGNKPNEARIEDLADKLQEKAPAEIQSFLDSLRTGEDKTTTGEVARILLRQFAHTDSLRPYVEQAAARSEEPHMALDPLTLGAFTIVLLAAMSSKIRISVKDGGIEGEYTGGAPKLVRELAGVVEKLPEVLKALPESALKQIASWLRPSTT